DLLPGAGDGARIAAEDRCIEVADVDAQLQGIGADHAAHRTVAKAVLDLAPLQRQVAAPVAADGPGLAQAIREGLLQVAEQDLDLQTGAAEDDGLHPAPQELLRDSLALQRRRATDPELPVDDRRV